MCEELEKQLEKEFPFMQKSRYDEHNLYHLYGCECGDGWYNLIHELCQEISERYEQEGKEADIVIAQVKEKFATLRFYYEYEDVSVPIHAFDFFGGPSLRFTPNDGGDEETVQLRNDIANIVRSYEAKSGSVCEKCGKAGKIRKDLRWIRTLCEDCYSDYPK